MNLETVLKKKEEAVSVPCRIDFGGTLDISTFYLAFQNTVPSSINMALDLRTRVTLSPFKKGWIKVSSRGFEPAEFEHGRAPFNHPMGLMFCVAHYFDAHGVHVRIESSSPPKSALGGSSSAAVAMAAAFSHALGKPVDPESVAWLAHYLEAGVAGVPCGMQDQLAAAFGGVNRWVWQMGRTSPVFERHPLFDDPKDEDVLNSHILIAYCGIPHVSRDINSRWVRLFIDGSARSAFESISNITQRFWDALGKKDFKQAAELMNRETQIRLELTPDVLDDTGKQLFAAAQTGHCGTRFTGAGGGGCLWAIGKQRDINTLKPVWQKILDPIKDAKILDAKIENQGIIID
ncbi:MAG: galactokinase [Desulfobacterales bacterium]|nr:galactokinase [Desulfobacterales bacterium]